MMMGLGFWLMRRQRTVLDVEPSSPTFMQPLSEYETREYVSIHNFTGSGTKTYFTYYQDGVRVVDLANPAAPKQLGYFNTWDPGDPDAATSFFSHATAQVKVELHTASGKSRRSESMVRA